MIHFSESAPAACRSDKTHRTENTCQLLQVLPLKHQEKSIGVVDKSELILTLVVQCIDTLSAFRTWQKYLPLINIGSLYPLSLRILNVKL